MNTPVAASATTSGADALLHAARTGADMALTGGGSSAVKIFLLVTALSFASALVLSLTSFTRIMIVLSFLRQALGTPSLPPNQILAGLSLFLTMFIMAPTIAKVHKDALGPYLDDKISTAEAIERGEGPLRDWMLKQTRDDDLRLFFEIAGQARPARGDALPMTVVIPAFMVSELGTAFRMGLYLFIPMLLIDVLIASVLMSLGMMMVPPQMISLPLKIGVFLLAGGWHLVVSSLVKSF
ncbi:MAG TPA: flagellar type III secretion system pore protein FliP [Polyangia bacterium]|nr:flagellar type III secretion system pore protein FliP [Polyangia bacterium]